MTNWKSSILILVVLAALWIVPDAHAQSPQPPTNSVPNSPSSGTGAKRNKIPIGDAGTPACKDATAAGIKTPIGNAGTPACTDATAAGSNAGDRGVAGIGVAGKGACVPTDERGKGACVPTDERVFGACAAAVGELKASRVLIGALERENGLLKQRIETEKQLADGLTELNRTRKSETDALRSAVAAKNETIAAKDSVIASQDKLIAALKTKKTSPWRRLGDLLTGAAIFAILK